MALFRNHCEALGDLAYLARGQDPLGYDDELTFVEMMCSGSERARERLVLAHLGVALEAAARVFGRYPQSRVPLEEVVSWATEGMIRGVDKHDPKWGHRRVMHYGAGLRGAGRCIMGQWYPVRVPVYVWDSIGTIVEDYYLVHAWHEAMCRTEPNPVSFEDRFGLNDRQADAVDVLIAENQSFEDLREVPEEILSYEPEWLDSLLWEDAMRVRPSHGPAKGGRRTSAVPRHPRGLPWSTSNP